MNDFTETQRLNIVNEYSIFDTEAELEYDDITFLASRICNTQISTITFVDEKRQWFKSKVGFEHNENPVIMSLFLERLKAQKDIITGF